MDCDIRNQIRDSVINTRRKPGEPVSIHVKHDSNGDLGTDNLHGMIELTVEPTDPEGMLSGWFDDSWWTDVVQRWGDDAVTIHVAPTPIAVLHPVVLHHVEMIRRVSPRWRIVGYAYSNDICIDEDIEILNSSLFHEVRFMDEPRPRIGAADRMEPIPLEKLFARIREGQARKGTSSPVLIRLPSGSGPKISAPLPVQGVDQTQTQVS